MTRTYDYDRDSLPLHVERARELQERIAMLRDCLKYGPTDWDKPEICRALELSRSELGRLLSFRGVHEAVGGAS